MLKIRSLSKSFGPVKALSSIDLRIPAGKMVGIIGRSGAGKSTLLRLVNRLADPSAGNVVWKAGHSREYLGVARANFPRLEAVHVAASMGLLRTRLVRRGREPARETSDRLARNAALAGAVRSAALVLTNDGPIEIAGARLAAFVSGGDFRAS